MILDILGLLVIVWALVMILVQVRHGLALDEHDWDDTESHWGHGGDS